MPVNHMRPATLPSRHRREDEAVKRFDARAFGLTVRGARTSLSLRVAAKQIGISPATMLRVESGRACDIETFLRLCSWMGVNPGNYGGSRNLSFADADGFAHIRHGLAILEGAKGRKP